jgi:signal transduction histidine kinase
MTPTGPHQELEWNGASQGEGSFHRGPHLAHVRTVEGDRRSSVEPPVNDIRSRHLEQQRKDDFLSMASHELKTPITTLKAFLQLVSDGEGSEVLVNRSYLIKMADQVERLTRLVSDLLEVSKIQKGQIEFAHEPVAVDPLVREVVGEAQKKHPSHRFTLSGEADCILYGDRARIVQALTELLNNAVKFSPE